MCLKSIETGAIKFFINNGTTNKHYPLQSSSLGKPHTSGDVAPTPASSAGILHVEVPSDGLSRRLDVFHSSKMTTFEVEFEFRVKEEVIRTQIRRVWGLRNHWNILFGKRFVHGDGSVTGSVVVV